MTDSPQHVAIIMDGNGRWARSRGMPRPAGHRASVKVVRKVVEECAKRKVRYLPQPRGPGGASNNPIGGFLLCIPANLPPERVELAFEAIAWMTSPEAMKANVQNGFPVAPSLCAISSS